MTPPAPLHDCSPPSATEEKGEKTYVGLGLRCVFWIVAAGGPISREVSFSSILFFKQVIQIYASANQQTVELQKHS